uniref:Helix-turn-helix domain-containing protein n=1 Tax=Dendroctonus ponderosae TaxID=77166 RepID=A0AAR5QA52_DENPD
MAVEKDGRLPFLHDCHMVFRKPAHTDWYLHSGSNDHPSQKIGVIKTLTERVRRICEPSQLERDLNHLERAFGWNGYSKNEFNRAIRPRNSGGRPEKTDMHDERKGWACLPYIHGVADRIGRILEDQIPFRQNSFETNSNNPTRDLRSAKDKRDPLSAAGVYRVPCSCGRAYIGTTKRSVNTRITEHKRSCRLGQTEQPAVAEHALLDGHQICFGEVDVLHQSQRYSIYIVFISRLTRETIEIFKHDNNFSRNEEVTALNPNWKRVLRQTACAKTIEAPPTPHA